MKCTICLQIYNVLLELDHIKKSSLFLAFLQVNSSEIDCARKFSNIDEDCSLSPEPNNSPPGSRIGR